MGARILKMQWDSTWAVQTAPTRTSTTSTGCPPQAPRARAESTRAASALASTSRVESCHGLLAVSFLQP